MSFRLGSRLGPYEILSPLGAGGMGEVYRARDVKLNRDVALKVLPEAFALDADRLARFRREAQLLASLNHPNIAIVHGFEEADGTLSPASAEPGSGSTRPVRALVMELVEGDTLEERLRQAGSRARARARDAGVPAPGPPAASGLVLDEALRIARLIAEALDAAHEKGIVHRDLKPANIKITPDGVVKVLDFGLAKLATPEHPDGHPAASPTATFDGTHEGLVVGTAAYMSPEQARGQPVDKRTDIWAFGCVLYEMLTGRPAFQGPTVSDTIAAVLERSPDWSALPPTTPEPLRRLMVRMLAKERRKRLRDIGDAQLDTVAEPSAAVVATSLPSRASSVTRVAFALALLAVGALGGFAWSMLSSSEAPSSSPAPLIRLTWDTGLTTEPSISADGRLVAYASDRGGEGHLDIWMQQTTGGSAIRLTTDPANDREPAVSPEGGLIAFRSDRSPPGIYMVPALGGDARLVAHDGRGPRFSPDGQSIAFWTGGWLAPRAVGQVRRTYVVAAAGGEPTQVAGSLASAGDPVWSPDGRALLIFGRRATSGDRTNPDWWWVPLEGGIPVQSGVYERLSARGLAIDGTDTLPYPFAWTNTGVLFAAEAAGADSRGIWSIAVDPRSGLAAGEPVRVTSGTTVDTWPAVARDGRMVFAATTESNGLYALPLDANAGRPAGDLRRVRDDDADVGRSGASEDGRLLVFPRYEFGAGGIWVRDMRTGRERQLAATPRTPLNPIISADGRWVAYTVTEVETGGNSGPGAGHVVESDGGMPRKVCDACVVYHWTRDARRLLVQERRAGESHVILLDVASGTRSRIASVSGNVDRPWLSPNEQWIVFVTRGSVVTAPFHPDRLLTEQEWVTVHSGGRGRAAGLSPDGGLIYLLLETDGFRCLYAARVDPATGRPAGDAPFLVHHFHDASLRWGSTGFGSATVTGMFLADLFETRGNIWMTTIGSS